MRFRCVQCVNMMHPFLFPPSQCHEIRSPAQAVIRSGGGKSGRGDPEGLWQEAAELEFYQETRLFDLAERKMKPSCLTAL